MCLISCCQLHLASLFDKLLPCTIMLYLQAVTWCRTSGTCNVFGTGIPRCSILVFWVLKGVLTACALNLVQLCHGNLSSFREKDEFNGMQLLKLVCRKIRLI